jgi:hypothetical protein
MSGVPEEHVAALLKGIARGRDLAPVCEDVVVPLAVAKADRTFMAKAGEAYLTATCRVREQLMRAVLSTDNDMRAHILERQLAQREQAQKQFPAPEVVEAEGADTWKPIFARLSVDELEVFEGLMAGDGEPLRALIDSRARSLAADMMRAARAAEQQKEEEAADQRIVARRDSGIVDLLPRVRRLG